MISNFFKSFFRAIWERLRMVLRGKNSAQDPLTKRSADQAIYQSQSFLPRKNCFFSQKRICRPETSFFFQGIFGNHSRGYLRAAVALINFASASGAPGFLFGTFGNDSKEKNALKQKIVLQNESKNNLAVAPLADPDLFGKSTGRRILRRLASYYSAPTSKARYFGLLRPECRGRKRERSKNL